MSGIEPEGVIRGVGVARYKLLSVSLRKRTAKKRTVESGRYHDDTFSTSNVVKTVGLRVTRAYKDTAHPQLNIVDDELSDGWCYP